MEITYLSNKLVCVLGKNNHALVFAECFLGTGLTEDYIVTFNPALWSRFGCCAHITDEVTEARG